MLKQLMVKKKCNQVESIHKCNKTYFVRNRVGDPVPISVPALIVQGLRQDLIGGKAVNKVNILLILDENPDICRLYPLTKDKEQHYQDSIEFIGGPTDPFHLQTEEMDWTLLNAATGYEVWRQRRGHVPFRSILRKQSNTLLIWKVWLERNIQKIRNVFPP